MCYHRGMGLRAMLFYRVVKPSCRCTAANGSLRVRQTIIMNILLMLLCEWNDIMTEIECAKYVEKEVRAICNEHAG